MSTRNITQGWFYDKNDNWLAANYHFFYAYFFTSKKVILEKIAKLLHLFMNEETRKNKSVFSS